VSFGVGSTTLGIELSDVAVLAVVVAAATSGFREGWSPLRAAARLWLLEALFLAWVVAATVHPLLWQRHYPFLEHALTAAKFCEYGLLAPAAALLLRRRRDAVRLLAVAICWSAAATGWALLQFAGVVSEFEGRRPLQREPSFVGIHDFAALSGASLSVALAVLVYGPRSRNERVLAAAGAVAGGVGLVLSSAVAGALGVGLAALAMLGVGRARGLVTPGGAAVAVACTAAAAAGVLLMRSGNIAQSIRAAGIGSEPKPQRDVASYTHRSLLAYIGIRMFGDHPVAGVGWQGSEDAENYAPYLAAAHRRFPDEPRVAFPSPAHAWGVQNAYLQTLTDLGLVGLAALAALFVAAVVAGVRASLRAPPEHLVAATAGLLWLLVAAGVWNGLGLVAGIPLDALTWLAIGLIGAAVAWTDAVA
jgi:O-Antigen ligase